MVPVTRKYAATFVGRRVRRECWEAVSTDGRFIFRRLEMTGTPWVLLDGAEDLGLFSTLDKARRRAFEVLGATSPTSV